MSGEMTRQELKKVLCRYISDTFSHVDTVRGFCEGISEWMDAKKTELEMLMNIKDQAEKIDMTIKDVTQSKEKRKGIQKYVKSKLTQLTADKRRGKLQNELADVLKGTLKGLEELDNFLDAVEKLAVTSLHVFKDDNQVLNLPKEINLKSIHDVITAARKVCPLLITFKRDAEAFFLTKLQNVEVLSCQLERYIQTTQKICENSEFCPKMDMKNLVSLTMNCSEDDIKQMVHHITQLEEIRMNQNFRMVFLFQRDSGDDFIREFSERQLRMNQSLEDLEKTAVQLDRMNKGAKISSVAGGSLGLVGGVLSIAGFALMPFTAGVSLPLTMAGVGLGILSGTNGAVTSLTEIGVKRKIQKEANEIFQSFMENVQSLQGCLEKVTCQTVTRLEDDYVEVAVGVGKALKKVGGVGKGIGSLLTAPSDVKVLKSEVLISGAGKVVASDIPDIGQAAVKGPLALSKSAKAGLIVVDALSLGLDIFFILKNSIMLAKGSETKVSQFIRARAALWSSEMDSWKKIHNSLCEGQQISEKHQAVLDRPFYPERS